MEGFTHVTVLKGRNQRRESVDPKQSVFRAAIILPTTFCSTTSGSADLMKGNYDKPAQQIPPFLPNQVALLLCVHQAKPQRTSQWRYRLWQSCALMDDVKARLRGMMGDNLESTTGSCGLSGGFTSILRVFLKLEKCFFMQRIFCGIC